MGGAEGDIKPLYKGTDLGLVISEGINLGKSASIDARYATGQSNIAGSVSPLDVSVKNSALSFMVGYAF